MMRDVLLAARVELRDMKQRIAALIGDIDEELRRDDESFERILAAVRRHPRFHEPNPAAIPCASSGEPPLPAHGCYEPNDEP